MVFELIFYFVILQLSKNCFMNLFRLLFLIVLFTSCSSKKNILYVQDIERESTVDVKYLEYRVKVDDILKIDIITETIESSKIYNPSRDFSVSNNKESMIFNGYQVDTDGNINFPSLGKINVLDHTINMIRNKIFKLLVDNGQLLNPIIDVKLLNAHFTILGEVKSPGKYEFVKNNMDIFQAIGIAGDLTINGLRTDVKIIRDFQGQKTITSIDLTNSDFLTGSNFQIFSGDIIIINPNNTRIKNAGIIGNSGTLISLLSFLLSSIIVINN